MLYAVYNDIARVDEEGEHEPLGLFKTDPGLSIGDEIVISDELYLVTCVEYRSIATIYYVARKIPPNESVRRKWWQIWKKKDT